MVQQNHQEGEREHDDRKILSVDSRSFRDLGGSYGVSFDKGALDQLGVIDENGNANADARQVVYSDGTATIEIDVDD